jgi:hypothetical protein
MAKEIAAQLGVLQAEAAQCTRCHAHGLVHLDDVRGVARPMLQRNPTGVLGILVVGEAPNWDDTYDPTKGYLTYEKDRQSS